ncbi:MAG: response regulator, partial [Nitrospira sp.]|nr:response regulator [Nitrospira sp.]
MDRRAIQILDRPIGASGSGESQAPLILVVDDCSDVRAILASRLSSLGYRVIEAEDGEQALELLKRTMPDLTIL